MHHFANSDPDASKAQKPAFKIIQTVENLEHKSGIHGRCSDFLYIFTRMFSFYQQSDPIPITTNIDKISQIRKNPVQDLLHYSNSTQVHCIPMHNSCGK